MPDERWGKKLGECPVCECSVYDRDVVDNDGVYKCVICQVKLKEEDPSSTQLIKEDDRTINLKFSTNNIDYNKQFNSCIEMLGIKDSHIKII